MAFITLCWRKPSAARRSAGAWSSGLNLGAAVLLVLFLGAGAARAEGIQVKSAELKLVDEVYQLDAAFDVSLTKPLEEALNKGVPLNFVVEFGLVRPRAYWLAEDIANVQLSLRLSYHALTRQYQLNGNTQHRNFNSLAEALAELSKVSEWQVFDRSLLKKRYGYTASLRMKLDVWQLPKPLLFTALGSKEWNLASEWHEWPLLP